MNGARRPGTAGDGDKEKASMGLYFIAVFMG
jgi:hypothetical protein